MGVEPTTSWWLLLITSDAVMTVTTEPLPHHVGLPVVGGFSHEIYGPGGADGGASDTQMVLLFV